jgi:hypothetical protein
MTIKRFINYYIIKFKVKVFRGKVLKGGKNS